MEKKGRGLKKEVNERQNGRNRRLHRGAMFEGSRGFQPPDLCKSGLRRGATFAGSGAPSGKRRSAT